MSPALVVLACTVALALALGLLARRGRAMDLEQWALGGRGFGALFVFVLMAGEIYTTFTFLGGSGWAYGRGAPAFYILCYGSVAYALSYLLLPAIWRYASTERLHSQSDFFERKYGSRALGVLAALVGVTAMVPYLVLQLKGLGIIVSETSYGRIPAGAAVWMSVAVLVLYVVVSGVRGSVWTAMLKDAAILAVAVGLGVWLPIRHYGGLANMFAAIEQAHPGFFALPAKGMSPSWFLSTVALTAMGFYMWPHAFAAVYTARDERAFRRNAALMPLYQLVLLFVFFAGFAAVLRVPGLAGADADLALLRLSKLTFGPWTVGVIGAAGLLTALVPGSILLLSSATILAKNVRGAFVRDANERDHARFARACVPALALVAALFALRGGAALVPLLLLGYNLVTQLFPALLASLPERPWATAPGAVAGIVTGEALVAWFQLAGLKLATLFPAWPAVVTDLNIGLVALCANAAVMLAVSAVTRRRAPRAA